MFQEDFYRLQDASVMSLIESSLYRCAQAKLPRFSQTLPEITPDMRNVCQQNVSGYTRLIRESSPAYYRYLTETLDAHHAMLFYITPEFGVYAHYGNQGLREELKRINLRFGTAVDETVIGTNAAVIAARSQSGVWTVGEQNYAEVLWPYAFFAFTVHARYDRDIHVMLAVRKKELNETVYSLFKLIEATESAFSAGMLTPDILLKEAFIGSLYGDTKAENFLIIVDHNGRITYANDQFYKLFCLSWNQTINYPLEQIVPELDYTLSALSETASLPPPRQMRFRAGGPVDYYVTCSPQSSKGQSGLVITAQKAFTSFKKRPKSDQGARYDFDDLIGTSTEFIELKNFAQRIADTDCTVLIRGESGTGKELFAHAIHNASHRWDKPFISVNCAAIPRDLISSELFGYVGGAFTGASRSGAKGKFEQANGGTLFLDEIGEMPIDMQSVLLRVLEEDQITRIGSAHPVPIDVRLIVATNQDLETFIKDGKFRLDLFYRLNIISLNMIPLREHREDIDILTDSFISHFSASSGRPVTGISQEARAALRTYDWPGNIRELRNTIEQCVVTAYGNNIQLTDLPENVRLQTIERPMSDFPTTENMHTVNAYVFDRRRDTVERLMHQYDGNKSKVAQKMGIARSTLYRILRDMGWE